MLKLKYYSSLFLVFSICLLQMDVVFAQKKSSKDTIRFIDRFSVRTNCVNWAIGIPNGALEFDLSGKDYGKWTINLEGQYRWTTKQTLKSAWVYSRKAATMEVRRYYRTELNGDSIKDWKKPRFTNDKEITILDQLKYFLRLQRGNARFWRAYYLGPYVEGGYFSYKFSKYGYQGVYYSGGISFGYNLPLYSFDRTHFLDVEFGTRAGFSASRSDKYYRDEESNCYRFVHGKYQNWHIQPFPVITDVHISLVYRSKGVRNKYKEFNEARRDKLEKHREARIKRTDSLIVHREIRKHINDSIRQARKDTILYYRAIRLHQDSIRQAERDSVKALVLQMREMERAEKLSKKQQKEEPHDIPVPQDTIQIQPVVATDPLDE